MEYIDEIKDKLYDEINETQVLTNDKVVKLSQELDKLIFEYYESGENN